MTIRGTHGYFGRAAFTAYLKQLPPEEVVGERGVGCSCPLTMFLKHIEPAAIHVDSTPEFLRYCKWTGQPTGGHPQSRRYETPKWARYFIYRIDANQDSPNGPNVTAAEALACLEQ